MVFSSLHIFLQFLPKINYVWMVVVFFLFLFSIFKKNDLLLMISILSSPLVGTDYGINVFNYGIAGLKLGYVMVLSGFFLILIKNSFHLPVATIPIVVFGSIFTLIGLMNDGLYHKYLVQEVFLLIIFFSYFVILSYTESNYVKQFIDMGLALFLIKCILLTLQLGVEVTSYSASVQMYQVNWNLFEYVVILFSSVGVFRTSEREYRLKFLLSITFFILSCLLQGYVHGGSIALLTIFLIMYLIINFLSIKSVFIIFTFIFIFYYGIDILQVVLNSEESVFKYKIIKVLSLVDYVIGNLSISELPRSAAVRLYELISLTSDPLTFSFGKGIGGALSCNDWPGNFTLLNKDDFSNYELDRCALNGYHSVNSFLFSFGFMGLSLFCVFHVLQRAQFVSEKQLLFDTLGFIILFCFGYTILSYIILAIYLDMSLRRKFMNYHAKY